MSSACSSNIHAAPEPFTNSDATAPLSLLPPFSVISNPIVSYRDEFSGRAQGSSYRRHDFVNFRFRCFHHPAISLGNIANEQAAITLVLISLAAPFSLCFLLSYFGFIIFSPLVFAVFASCCH